MLMLPASLRNACDMRRACRPTWDWPISPSISARGVSAATESITIMSSAPDRTRVSVISSACSPVSGCEIRSSSTSTPMARAYSGSSACSASMKAQIPPFRCASAIRCSASDTPLGDTANAESHVQRKCAGWNRFDRHVASIAELHDSAAAVALLDRLQCHVECFISFHDFLLCSCATTPVKVDLAGARGAVGM